MNYLSIHFVYRICSKVEVHTLKHPARFRSAQDSWTPPECLTESTMPSCDLGALAKTNQNLLNPARQSPWPRQKSDPFFASTFPGPAP